MAGLCTSIMECGGVCAEPKSAVMLATVRQDGFDLDPMAPKARCTPGSVAAHTLYEKTRPDLLAGPVKALMWSIRPGANGILTDQA